MLLDFKTMLSKISFPLEMPCNIPCYKTADSQDISFDRWFEMDTRRRG